MTWAFLFLASIILANMAVILFGIVPIGFGLMAPAGVYFAGLGFTFRDLTHDYLARKKSPRQKGPSPVMGPMFFLIIFGAGLSALVSPSLALASGVAFLFSETADFLVYTPLREKRWITAVICSNLVGLTLDSIFFLWLAFGSLDFLAGQVVAKVYMTLLAASGLYLWRRSRRG